VLPMGGGGVSVLPGGGGCQCCPWGVGGGGRVSAAHGGGGVSVLPTGTTAADAVRALRPCDPACRREECTKCLRYDPPLDSVFVNHYPHGWASVTASAGHCMQHGPMMLLAVRPSCCREERARRVRDDLPNGSHHFH
jgi:hypothetical protein